MEKEQTRIFQIPSNITDGIVILGKSVPILWIFQGILMFSAVFVLAYEVLKTGSLFIDSVRSASIALPFFLLACHGIAGDSVLGFIIMSLRFYYRRRKCYYNHRIKKETELPSLSITIKSIQLSDKSLEQDSDEIFDSKPEKAEADNSLYFLDDLGIIPKPEEYMSFFEKMQSKRKKKNRKTVEVFYEE